MEETLTIPEQIEQALDGRTRRWLSMKIGVHESDLSKKMTGKVAFTAAEIDKVNEALNVTIQMQNEEK